MKKIFFILIAILTINIATAQQFNVTGNATATSTPGCYNLTNALNQAGAIWNIYTIDLAQPFDVMLKLNFGNRPDTSYNADTLCGGDGMSFILCPTSSNILPGATGMGFHGIAPSLGVLMDTHHYDAGDPNYDHISINRFGDESDTSINVLFPYTNAVGVPTTFTDGLDHLFRFVWNPATMTIQVYLGNETSLPSVPTIVYANDIINNIFLGNPVVYWGVAASTGSCWNNQSVCMTTLADFVCDTIVCSNIPVHFFDNSISEAPIASWSWDFGNGMTSLMQNPAITYQAAGTYIVKLTIYNMNGLSSTMTHTMTINPMPVIIVNNNTICLGDTVVLTATGAIDYYWSNGSTNQSITVSPVVTTSYIVTGENQYHCFNSDTALVIVNPLPVAEFTMVADTTIPHHYYIINNAWGISPLKYLWSWGDGTQDTIAYPSHTYSAAGTYKICLYITDSTGCTNYYCDSSYLNKSDNSIIAVDVIPQGTLGINTNEIATQIKIYPNPAKDILTVEANSDIKRFEIINLIGETVYTQYIYKKALVNISAFAKGVYFLKLTTDKEIVVRKFVKD